MKILYDHQMFSMQKYGGVTRYFCDLMNNLPSWVESELGVEYSENQYLRESGNIKLKDLSLTSNFRVNRRVYSFLNSRISTRALKANQFDVFHPTYYSPYFLNNLSRPFVLTVHDMIHEKFKELFPFYDTNAANKKELIKKASHIIAVSQHTKNDLIDLLDVDESRITVVQHGYKQRVEASPQLYTRYILFVGERKNYKNFTRFAEAITPLLKEDSSLKLVCTGNAFNGMELNHLASLQIQSQVIHHAATDSELASLYKYALVFVFPSLYEGFGIPILEAFANECPVCLSSASCFPEIARQGALYFDPLDKESIQETVRQVITDQSLSSKLVEEGRSRLTAFSLDNMVNKTCNVYRSVL